MKKFNAASWYPQQLAVLCFVLTDNKVLLIHKLRGLGTGKINAPGGKCEPGEKPIDTAIRETQEEVCISPHGLCEMGVLRFQFADGFQLEGRVFTASDYSGQPGSTPEADPFWCSVDRIPYDRMWADDILWLPSVLSGSYIDADYSFDGDTMTTHTTRVLGPPYQNQLSFVISSPNACISGNDAITLRDKLQQLYSELSLLCHRDSPHEACMPCCEWLIDLSTQNGFHQLAESVSAFQLSLQSGHGHASAFAALEAQYLRAISFLGEQTFASTVLY